MSRPLAREAAMQLLFEQLFGGEGEADTLVDLIGYTPDAIDAAYIHEVVTGVLAHEAVLDQKIATRLRGWTLDRISKVDHAILRLAVFEMEHMHLPAGVAINEAIELTRKFSGESSCAFVNGVLGAIHRAAESEE